MLYRLGYVDRADLGVVPSLGTISSLVRRKRESKSYLSRFLSLFASKPSLSSCPPQKACLKVCVLG